MSKSEAIQVVLTPMRTVFSPPPTMAKGDEEAALEQYADALRGFAVPVLEAGWREVRDANRRGFWPAIGALVEACLRARERFSPPKEPKQAVNGRLVGGRYQPWVGCECARCLNQRNWLRSEREAGRSFVAEHAS